MGRADSIVATIEKADRAGLDVAWLTVGGAAPDPFAVFAAAAMRTDRIRLGTAIVPTFPRHPLALAQGAIAIDQLAPGRLRLGVGPSHKPAMEGTWGIPFQRPLTHLREYVTILNAILKDGRVAFHGELLHADAQIAAPTQVEILASALRPRAFRLCGELTDGAISWMCPRSYLHDVATPAMQEGAATAGRPKPPLVAHVPVVVSEDRDAVRAAAHRQFGFYPRLPFYSQMLQDAGFPEAADGVLTDAMVDALVISGNEHEVAEQIAQLPNSGVDEMLAAIVLFEDDPQPAYDRTLELLGALAQQN
jgi:F420-dependent oxidoreductase-like protein